MIRVCVGYHWSATEALRVRCVSLASYVGPRWWGSPRSHEELRRAHRHLIAARSSQYWGCAYRSQILVTGTELFVTSW